MNQNSNVAYVGKIVDVKIDRTLGSTHPKHGFKYEANYGFIPDTKAPDGEELDAYVLGIDVPVESFRGKVIAVIHRTNDDDDNSVISGNMGIHKSVWGLVCNNS